LIDGLEDLENNNMFDPASISLEGLDSKDFSFLIDEPVQLMEGEETSLLNLI